MQSEDTPDYSGGHDDSADRTSIGERPSGYVGDNAGGDNGGREDNRHFRRQRHRECYCRGRNKNCPKCGGTGQLLPNWRENLNNARQSGPRPSGLPSPEGNLSGASGMSGYDRPPRSSEGASDRNNDRPSDRSYERLADRGSDRSADRSDRSDRPSERSYSDRPVIDRPQSDRPQSDRSDRPSRDRYNDRPDRYSNRDSGGGGGGGREDRYGGGGGDRGDRASRRDRWQNQKSGRGGSTRTGSNTKSTIKMCPMCGEYTPNLRQHVLARHDD